MSGQLLSMSRVTGYTRRWLPVQRPLQSVLFEVSFVYFLASPMPGMVNLNVHTAVSGLFAIQFRRYYRETKSVGSSGTQQCHSVQGLTNDALRLLLPRGRTFFFFLPSAVEMWTLSVGYGVTVHITLSYLLQPLNTLPTVWRFAVAYARIYRLR